MQQGTFAHAAAVKEQEKGRVMLSAGLAEGIREGREVFLEETGEVRLQHLAKLLLFFSDQLASLRV